MGRAHRLSWDTTRYPIGNAVGSIVENGAGHRHCTPPCGMSAWHSIDLQELERKLGTGEAGLSPRVAADRLREGPNEIVEPPPTPMWLLFVRQFKSPLIYLLVAATVVTFLLGRTNDSTVIAVVLLITRNPLLALGVVALAFLLARMWMQRRIVQRMMLFEGQLIDGLELEARSLRAGHPLAASFQLIADEIKPPVSTVFGEICQRQTLGVSMEEALRLAAARSGSADLNLFSASVIIQIRSGGNLADMMDRLACVVRDRRRLRGVRLHPARR